MSIIRHITGKSGDYAPGYGVQDAGGNDLQTDPGNSVMVRGQVLTDEGGYRVNFSGNSLGINIGTISVQAGSPIVSGSGFSLSDISTYDYIKLASDPDSNYEQISSIDSDSQITLTLPYASTGVGLGSNSVMNPSIGSGGSYSVASSQFVLNSGTTANSISEIERIVDYPPITKQCGVTISQRILNQNIMIGFYDENHSPNPWYWAWFRFNGTDSTKVICEVAYSRSGTPTLTDIESNLVTFPNGLTSASANRYRIEALPDRIRFLINDILVSTTYKVVLHPNAILTSTVRIVNGAVSPASSTTMSIDYDTVLNFNRLYVSPSNESDPIPSASADTETMVDLLNVIVSRLPFQVYGAGAGGVSIPRVTVSSDSSLAANQSCNVAQFGGQNIATGVGLGGNGVPRVTLSADSFLGASNTVIGSTLPIIYNNIVCS